MSSSKPQGEGIVRKYGENSTARDNDPRPHDHKRIECEPGKRVPPRVIIKKKKPCRRFGRPHQNCCDQVIEVLKSIPGVNKDLFHKPKVPNEVKIERLCCNMSIKDSTVPIFFHIMKRFLGGKTPLNEFEKRVFESLKKINEKGLKALASSLASYEKLPKDKRECIYKKEFLEWPIDQPIGIDIILKEWITEGLFLLRQKMEPKGGSLGGPGKVRKWDQTSTGPSWGGPGEFSQTTFRAPWPWICQVSPGASQVSPAPSQQSPAPASEKWFRDMDYEVPGSPPFLLPLRTHEQDVTCDPKDPNAPADFSQMYQNNTIDITEVCTPKMPSSTSDNLFAICDGGEKYTHPQGCLKIPDVFPGQDVRLKGFNFFSDECKVKLTKKEDPSVMYDLIDPWIIGDEVTPIEDENKKIIANCSVEDVIRFTIPTLSPNDGTFDPGIYEVKVIVPNDSNQEVLNVNTGQQEYVPSTFESNPILLNIWPDPDLVYNIWNDVGHCHTETSGGGADEIWWTAGVASFKLDAGIGKFTHSLNVTRAPEDPWSDMDDGEDPDPYSWPLFNGTVGMPGSVAIALIGYEIDDEDVAEEQLKDWSDAFNYAISEIWEALLSLGAGILIEIVKAIAAGGIWGLVAAIIVVVIVFIIVAIWASWAPPDLIAQDIMTFSTLDLFDNTKTNSPVPPDSSYVIMDDGEQRIHVTGVSWKDPSIVESTLYTSQKMYYNYELGEAAVPDETGEGWTTVPTQEIESHYELRFKISRISP